MTFCSLFYNLTSRSEWYSIDVGSSMPIASIEPQGTRFYYEDSGVPVDTSTNYKTLVLIHGTLFNSGTNFHSEITTQVLLFLDSHLSTNIAFRWQE